MCSLSREGVVVDGDIAAHGEQPAVAGQAKQMAGLGWAARPIFLQKNCPFFACA
jgi:hypothetical protein